MRGIGRELALHVKPLLQAVEGLVDGGHQRQDLARNPLGGKADVGPGGSDAPGLLRGPQQRSHGATENQDVGGEQDQEDRDRDPANPPEEVGDDVVDDHVAMRQILGNLDAQCLAAEQLGGAGTGNPVGQGRQSRRTAMRRKQQIVVRIVDVIAVAAISVGVEPPQAVRQVEHDLAGGIDRKVLAEVGGLIAHRLAMQLVDLRIEQPQQQQRQEDRSNRDRHDVQEYDPRGQRRETEHAYFSSAIR